MCGLTYHSVIAQTNPIPNNSFETWANNNPDKWGTLNSVTSSFGVYTATQSSDAYAGNSALLLENKSVPFVGVAPGVAVTGTINTSTYTAEGGFAYASRPAMLTGYIKYSPATGDSALITVLLHKWNTSTGTRDTIGGTVFVTGTMSSSYTQFTAPILYKSNGVPDTAIITLSATKTYTSAPVGSKLYVDALDFVAGSGISEQQAAEYNVKVYPNPAADKISFQLPFAGLQLQIFDATGSLVSRQISSTQHTTFDFNSSNGIYFYQTINKNGSVLGKGKFIINK